MDKELDEADVLRLLDKVKKAGCFEILQKLNNKIISYINAEWDRKPTNEEVLQVICQFYGMPDEDLDKLFEAVTNEEFTTLAAMIYGALTED